MLEFRFHRYLGLYAAYIIFYLYLAAVINILLQILISVTSFPALMKLTFSCLLSVLISVFLLWRRIQFLRKHPEKSKTWIRNNILILIILIAICISSTYLYSYFRAYILPQMLKISLQAYESELYLHQFKTLMLLAISQILYPLCVVWMLYPRNNSSGVLDEESVDAPENSL